MNHYTSIDLSIVIVTYNTEKITFDCVQSIYNSKTQFNFEVIVVDNCSSDNTINTLRESFANINIISSSENIGFSKGNNLGILSAKGKYILLLNSDTLGFENSIENLMVSAIHNNYDICGPILLNADLTIQRSWFNFPSTMKVFLRLTDIYLIFYKLSNISFFKLLYFDKKPAFMIGEMKIDSKMDYLSFACILIKKDVIDEIGGLDESLFFYHEDCEYGFRAKQYNYSINYTIASKVIHFGGTSSNKFSFLAFENDINGLLHVCRKYYSLRIFKRVKYAIILALQWRILFWHFGYYRQIKRFGLYVDNDRRKIIEEASKSLKKYKEIKQFVLSYK